MVRPRIFRRGSGNRRTLGVIALLIAFAFLLTGCDRVTGGGWIPSLSPTGGRATFSFTAKCRNRTIEGIPTAVFYEGQFEFDDHGFNPLVRVHGDVEPAEFFNVPGQSCRDLSRELDLVDLTGFQGTYRTQPEVFPSGQGEFAVAVFDGGESGINGDEICVSLAGGIEYLNCGVVQGGNIQVQ
jgi:hypothetical protein